jgi:type IV pilus assembly protein PilY1
MKRPYRLALSLAVATALSTMPPSFVGAEDIDLFVGNGPVAQNPNVLIILDNSANWSAANQNWEGGIKQGQAELWALNQVVGALKVNTDGSATINVGLMMFTEGTGGGNKDGGYIRFAIRPMTAANKTAFQQLVGDPSCTYSATSLNTTSVPPNNTPNCIYGNFDKTEDQVGSGLADYQAAMFEAFKYFGGWTYPADAKADPQFAADPPPNNPQSASEFGPYRYAGNLSKSDFVARLDSAAFVTQWSQYQPPIDASNNCANNYIIFIGNGYVDDSTAKVTSDKSLMTGVSGDTTHLSMAEFSTTTNPTTDLGSDATCHTAAQCQAFAATTFPGYDSYTCSGGTTSAGTTETATTTSPGTCERSNVCESNGSTYLPGYTTYSCTGGTSATCSGSERKNWTVTGTRTVGVCSNPSKINQTITGTKNIKTTTRTGTEIANPTNPDYKEKLADEWAKYLFKTDVNSAIGVQNVKTYAIDVFKDQPSAAQNSLLLNMARAGGDPTGLTYFQATNIAQIILALEKIFAEIQSVNSVFAAASLPVSATNRAQNENQVFFGLFRPDELALPRWYGNLKRYQIAKVGTQIILAGQDATQSAINNNTGFFFDCAKSFWTTDSGSYWNFSGGSPSACALPATPPPSSAFSDLPDGPQVEKGGAGEVLRRGNDPTATAPFTVNRNMFSCANDGSTINCSSLVAFADATATITADAFATPAPTAGERTNIINYTRGQNIKNEKLDADLTQPRPSIHGDVVHSRPLPINYGLSTDKSGTKVVAIYGTNDGALRAISTNDGRELWSFIAPEHHSRLKRLYDNDQKIAFPNILAQHALTPLTPAPAAKDYFFDGTIGVLQNIDNSKIWIFPTMRRGGRMLYAFDITPTDPTNPTPQTTPLLKWRKGCTNSDLSDTTSCDSGFEDMGQTWSTPNIAFIKNFSTTVPVIVVGGGYDTCEDKDGVVTSVTGECATAKGRKVYVLNADTGAIIRSFDTTRSVPADVTLVDTDFDGFVDYAYAADTGGNVYRINFTGVDSTAWSQTTVAHASSDGRKFLFPPAALVAKDASGNIVIFLGLGSGDRERPLLTNYPVTTSPQLVNRFYVFLDKFTGTNLDLETLTVNDPLATPTTCEGWKMNLVGDPEVSPAKVGEQTVTGALIAGGRVFWNTSRATQAAAGTCDSDLGEARGYNAGLFTCGGVIDTTYVGGGLPITPVLGTVTLADGSVVTVCIGCAMDPDQPSQFTPGQVNPAPAATRKRLFWKRDGDK